MTHPRRRALAVALREAREAASLTQEQLRLRLGWHQTKVARFESGRRLPSEADLAAWAQATGVDADAWLSLLEATRDYAVLARDAAKTPDGLVAEQRELQTLEQASALVAEYQPMLIPGLAQTRGYAYEWLTQPGRPDAPNGTDWQAVADTRIARQGAVLGDPDRRVVIAVAEAALWAVYGRVETQQAQLDHLAALAVDDVVELIVVPSRRTLAVMSGFELLDDAVSLETGQGLRLRGHPDVLGEFRAVLENLRQTGATGLDAVALVRDVARRL